MNGATCSQYRGGNRQLKTVNYSVKSDLMAVNCRDAQGKGARFHPRGRDNFLWHLPGELKEALAKSKARVGQQR